MERVTELKSEVLIYKDFLMKIFEILKNKSNKEETPNTTVEKPIEWLKPEAELQTIYSQKPEKVDRIVKSLEKIGYDKSQLIITKPDGRTKDGYSRLAAIRKYNELHPEKAILTVPVFIQDYQDKEDDLLYAIHLSTDRRRLEDDDLFSSFKTFEEFRNKAKADGKSTKEYSDKRLAETLNISERQISKLRYVLVNGSNELHNRILSGSCTIARAEREIKEKNGELKNEKNQKNSFDYKSFSDGVCFGILENLKGKSLNEILSDPRVKDNKVPFVFTEEEKMKIANLCKNS